MFRLLPRYRILAGYLSAFVVVLICALTFHSAQRAMGAYRSAHESVRVMDILRSIGTDLQDAEASVREYVLTGDTAALAPYRTVQANSDPIAEQFRQLSATSRYGTRLDSLAYFFRLRLAELGQSVRSQEQVVPEIAADFPEDAGAAHPTQGEFRRLLTVLTTDIDAELQHSSDHARRDRILAIILGVVAFVVVLGGAFLTNAVYKQQSREQQRTYDELEQQSLELRQQTSDLALANTELEQTTREMVQQTAEAEANRLQLAGILGSVTDAILSYDDAHRIVYFNSAAERIFGVEAKEVIGRVLTTFIPEDARDRFEERMGIIRLARKTPATGSHRWEAILWRKDGSEFQADISVSYARAIRQGLFTATVRDVTEQRKLEKQLREAQKMEAVGQLAGGIAHDFNNLLTVIGASSEFLLQMTPAGEGADEVREDIVEIRRATDRAAALTRQLLTFSRRQRVQPELLDLNSVVRDMDTMLRRLVGENIRLDLALGEEPIVIRIDQGQMEQIIVNLAMNARDAMPHGGELSIIVEPVPPEIAVPQTVSRNGSAGHVMLTVRDTGMGMDADVQSRIFEPFFTTKERGKGTGLGLPTVYGMVQQSGGEITVHSVVGRGSEFVLYFPHAEESEVPQRIASSPSDELRGTETVLIVEDEEALRRLARRILESRGYEVLEASNGRHAIQVMARHSERVDLLLTDVVMPVMGGRELVERLLPVYPMVRVLFMSGYNEDTMLQHRIVEFGINVLEKPFTPETLARAVRSALDREPDRQAPVMRSAV